MHRYYLLKIIWVDSSTSSAIKKILRVAAVGVKQYGFELRDENSKISHMVKIRTFKMNGKTSEKLNFERLAYCAKNFGQVESVDVGLSLRN